MIEISKSTRSFWGPEYKKAFHKMWEWYWSTHDRPQINKDGKIYSTPLKLNNKKAKSDQ